MKGVKKLREVDKPEHWQYVYKATNGEEEFEGTITEIAEHFNLNDTYLRRAVCRDRKSGYRVTLYREFALERTYLQSTERLYAVINDRGEKVTEGSARKLSLQFGYPLGTIKTYCSNSAYMVIRRRKYYFRPINKWNLVWKPAK